MFSRIRAIELDAPEYRWTMPRSLLLDGTRSAGSPRSVASELATLRHQISPLR